MKKSTLKTRFACLLLASFVTIMGIAPQEVRGQLQAGAAVVDVTPEQLPVLINGGMLSRSANNVVQPIHARAIVLDDGQQRLAIVVVDSCMMPRSLLDEAKALAGRKTNIRAEDMLIAATHTHTAPAAMGCLGTDADPAYVPFLRQKLVEVIVAAEANLEPARVGWAVGDAGQYTALRRWIRRPDRIADDPFGNPTVRANMHAGRNWDDVIGESGPKDPDLSLISFQSNDGRPLAVLANFSMHYFSGVQAIHPDYFGLFAEGLKQRLASESSGEYPPFVGMMSHGCSGDIWRRDYTKPPSEQDTEVAIDQYTDGLLDIALDAYQTIQYQEDADIAMAEARLELKYRVPDKQHLEWAERIVEAMGNRDPENTEEVYAREQILLHQQRSAEVVVQALRIGNIGIATTPTETYALTGLKIKRQSPLPDTMVFDLANGGDGYIPPPEQHLLGGYNTWPARSAALEVQAEPKITETALQLLEQVSGRQRRPYVQTLGPAAASILELRPVAYWRLDEFSGLRAVDRSGNNRDGIYEHPVAFFLEGPRSDQFCQDGETNRAAHFAGGRLKARLAELDSRYSVSLWFWNGMPNEGRAVTGWMFSRGRNHGLAPHGDHVGLGGTDGHPGRLIYLQGDGRNGIGPVAGQTEIPRWTWHHLVLVRDGSNVRIHLNGDTQPEIETEASADVPAGFDQLFFGGRSDNQFNWEGRLDEIAVFDRALTEEEMTSLSVRDSARVSSERQ